MRVSARLDAAASTVLVNHGQLARVLVIEPLPGLVLAAIAVKARGHLVARTAAILLRVPAAGVTKLEETERACPQGWLECS